MNRLPILRDFIETVDNLLFSVVTYNHPKDRIIAYLRYFPSEDGDREKNGTRYQKIESTQHSSDFLKKNFPEYIYWDELAGSELQSVPLDKVKRLLSPGKRLNEIISHPKTPLEKKVKRLSQAIKSVNEEKKGVTGSILAGTEINNSDIDFIIVGSENHKRARMELKKIFDEKREDVRPLGRDDWLRAYNKRFPGKKTIPFDEFMWHEERKYHKGIIQGTIFDILLVKNQDEIGNNEIMEFRRERKVEVSCSVIDSSLSFDYPALFLVECIDNPDLKEVVSYTHTYAGQALRGEKILVSGYLEEVVTTDGNYKRVLVGTTREAEDEYIRLKDIHNAALP